MDHFLYVFFPKREIAMHGVLCLTWRSTSQASFSSDQHETQRTERAWARSTFWRVTKTKQCCGVLACWMCIGIRRPSWALSLSICVPWSSFSHVLLSAALRLLSALLLFSIMVMGKELTQQTARTKSASR